jgi:3-oxoacyl-(acyl-carrier-protein) synthase
MTDPIDELRQLAAAAAPAPRSMDVYLVKVRKGAYMVTDADVEALKDAGLSEDEIFEHTVTVAIGEGLRRLDRAAEVIA